MKNILTYYSIFFFNSENFFFKFFKYINSFYLIFLMIKLFMTNKFFFSYIFKVLTISDFLLNDIKKIKLKKDKDMKIRIILFLFYI
jgi:hypothetical protein